MTRTLGLQLEMERMLDEMKRARPELRAGLAIHVETLRTKLFLSRVADASGGGRKSFWEENG